MDWFRLQNAQHQPTLIPHISVAAVNQETEEDQVKRLKEIYQSRPKDHKVEEMDDNSDDRRRKNSGGSQRSSRHSFKEGYLRKRSPVKKSYDSRRGSISVESIRETEMGQERLLRIMLNLFKGKNVKMDSIMKLNLDERQILSSLMIRKFGVNIK